MTDNNESTQKSSYLKGVLTGALLTALAALFLFFVAQQMGWGQSGDTPLTDKKHLEKLEYLENTIDQYYLHEKDDEKLADGMYAGLLAGLGDPYSAYYSAEEYNSVREENEGHYNGIGVVMQKGSDGLIRLINIYKDTPGDEAGLLVDDILCEVDGEDIRDLDLSQVADRIKNPDKKTTVLTVARDGQSDYLEIEIEKRDIEIPVVEHDMLDGHVGYIALYQFTETTAGQFREAIEDLRAQGMERLLIDLRDNPGGLLDSVCEILETILPKGLIVYTEDKYGIRQERTCEGKTPLDIPLVVLVNENSASASEIFAGAVQDYGIGTIVGTTTFGKGVVQTLKQLSDGSAVRLTISNYYTPNGNNINEKGIKPDVEVELDENLKQQNVIKPEDDNQLQKALEVLRKE